MRAPRTSTPCAAQNSLDSGAQSRRPAEMIGVAQLDQAAPVVP
jgi:hypothetical protein